MSAATDFLQIVRPEQKQAPDLEMGTIPANYVSGRPAVQFDGETIASTRTYPYLASYTPTAGDRVLVAMVAHGGVVIGKIV